MSTQPVSPVPAPSVVIQTAPPVVPTTVRTFLKNHETLLIFVLGFLLIWFVSGKVENAIAAHDNANLKTVQATLAAQVDANQKTAALVAQQAADYKALASKLEAQDTALAQANVALTQALTKRQSTDAVLPMPELVSRWSQLVPGSDFSSATVTPTGDVSVSPTNAHATVNELEKVPVLTAQLENEKTAETNLNTLLAASNGQVVTLNGAVDGLKLQITDDDKVCKAQIAVVKAQARKSKRRWFVAGFITGFASRQALKTYLGF